MCGIVGYVQKNSEDLTTKLMTSLRAMEYRGYDSAGLVTRDNNRLRVTKAAGDLSKLKERLHNRKVLSHIGMAHTRWATHGAPTERNALPILTKDARMAIVFNGIVENDFGLRQKLKDKGIGFGTENDAETLLEWIASHYRGDLVQALQEALPEIEGRYALAIMHVEHPGLLVTVKKSSPLTVGKSSRGFAVASDSMAIQNEVQEVLHLPDGVIAAIEANKITLSDLSGNCVQGSFEKVQNGHTAERGEKFETYTLQEIFLQPQTIADSVKIALGNKARMQALEEQVERVVLIGCGTAYYACCIGKLLIEKFARVPAEAALASEFRVATPVLNEKTLMILVSQSGETADTLGCLEIGKAHGAKTAVICNVATSTLAKAADCLFPIGCGPEIGVASTKAYTGMLVQLVFLSLAIGLKRGSSPNEAWDEHETAAQLLPSLIDSALKQRDQIEKLARSVRQRRNFAFMGRELSFPTACEGALKLRELSYRNAEGFGAGELKHGTLALIEQGYPVIAVAPRMASTPKMVGSIQEVKARGAKVIGIVTEGDTESISICDSTITLPATLPAFTPILSVIPLQLLAYEMARTLGRNIDRPRNLAKSVTVE